MNADEEEQQPAAATANSAPPTFVRAAYTDPISIA